MTTYFDQQFNNLGQEHLIDLRYLEICGAVYTEFWSEDRDGFVPTRIQFEPGEIGEYVSSLAAYDEFLGYINEGCKPWEAVEKLSDEQVKQRVESHTERAENREDANPLCAAAFLPEDVESLLCGGTPKRYESLLPD